MHLERRRLGEHVRLGTGRDEDTAARLAPAARRVVERAAPVAGDRVVGAVSHGVAPRASRRMRRSRPTERLRVNQRTDPTERLDRLSTQW
jgi:hypothetical protein